MYCFCVQKEKVYDVENMTYSMRAKTCESFDTNNNNEKFIKINISLSGLFGVVSNKWFNNFISKKLSLMTIRNH